MPCLSRHALAYVALSSLVITACADAVPAARRDTVGATLRRAPIAPPNASAPQSAHEAVPAKPLARAGDATRASKPARAVRRIVFGYADFTGVGHDRGNPDAPVVVIDLGDFACPYCGEFSRDVYPAIEREYVQTGKVLFKYIPFIAGSFPHAAEATRAAECAADQGQFWTMLDHLYATQAEWKRGSAADAQMAALASTLPLDTVKFAACYADRRTDARTARATAIANDIGVRVTPSFLVNGHPVQGALPLAEFRKQIQTALLLAASQGHGASGKAP